MKQRLPFGVLLAAISLPLVGGQVFAQSNQHPDRPPQRQQSSAPKPNANSSRPPARNPNANRPAPPANPNRTQGQPAPRNSTSDRTPSRQNQSPSGNGFQPNPNRPPSAPPSATMGPNRSNNFSPSTDRPSGAYSDRPNGGARLTPRQQVGVGSARPFVDVMRDMSPQQRDRALQSSRTFQNLAPDQQNRIRNQFNQWDRMSPQQRSDLREKENTWRSLTPQQRDHIKNDVLPQWRQLPWQRQQAIQQKLGVLQNMPESARNRRLADPNFTRGMSDEDRAMLHDLSHLHVGGAPDPPSIQP